MQHTTDVKSLLFPVIDCGIYAGDPAKKELFKIGSGIQNPKTGELYSYSFKPSRKCKFISNETALNIAEQKFGCRFKEAYYSLTDHNNEFHFFSNQFQLNVKLEIINSYSNQLPPKFLYCFQVDSTIIPTDIPALSVELDKDFVISASEIYPHTFKEAREKALSIPPVSVGMLVSKFKGVLMPNHIHNAITSNTATNAWEQFMNIAEICNLWANTSFKQARNYSAAVYHSLYIRL